MTSWVALTLLEMSVDVRFGSIRYVEKKHSTPIWTQHTDISHNFSAVCICFHLFLQNTEIRSPTFEFEVITAVAMKSIIFRHMTPCSPTLHNSTGLHDVTSEKIEKIRELKHGRNNRDYCVMQVKANNTYSVQTEFCYLLYLKYFNHNIMNICIGLCTLICNVNKGGIR
jgi:hypothetical protein